METCSITDKVREWALEVEEEQVAGTRDEWMVVAAMVEMME